VGASGDGLQGRDGAGSLSREHEPDQPFKFAVGPQFCQSGTGGSAHLRIGFTGVIEQRRQNGLVMALGQGVYGRGAGLGVALAGQFRDGSAAPGSGILASAATAVFCAPAEPVAAAWNRTGMLAALPICPNRSSAASRTISSGSPAAEMICLSAEASSARNTKTFGPGFSLGSRRASAPETSLP